MLLLIFIYSLIDRVDAVIEVQRGVLEIEEGGERVERFKRKLDGLEMRKEMKKKGKFTFKALCGVALTGGAILAASTFISSTIS